MRCVLVLSQTIVCKYVRMYVLMYVFTMYVCTCI